MLDFSDGLAIITRTPDLARADAMNEALDAHAAGCEKTSAQSSNWLRLRAPVAKLAQRFAVPLPQTPQSERAVNEIAWLAALFSEHDPAPELDLQLSWLCHRECPLFHVDRVTLRIICAYYGPGPEYLRHGHARRHGLLMAGRSADNDPVVRDPVQRVPKQAIALLRGSRHTDYDGAIHRSPPCPRLLLRLQPVHQHSLENPARPASPR